MCIDYNQDTIGSYCLKSSGSHEDTSDNTSLHVHRVLRHLVEVRCVDNVRVENKCVRHLSEKARYRSRIASVSTDLRSDPSGNE